MIRVTVKPQAIVSIGLGDTVSLPVSVGSTTMMAPSDLTQYKGPYDVTPKVEQQILSTANKIMKDDVTVRGIPYYEVSNDKGGKTVYIAKEID